jgi:hypothetical protein
MLWYNYLYENTMFTNKRDAALLERKMLGKHEVEKEKE